MAADDKLQGSSAMKTPTYHTEQAFLEFQVGKLFQEFLVGLVTPMGDPYSPQQAGLPGQAEDIFLGHPYSLQQAGFPGIPGWPTLPGIPG